MSVARKRTLAVAVAELRLGCDLVREAYVGPTGTAADRHDPLYNAALQHDDHCTRQKLEAGWQLGTRGVSKSATGLKGVYTKQCPISKSATGLKGVLAPQRRSPGGVLPDWWRTT